MNEQEFWDILAAAPAPQPVFYRLYYNPDGSLRCYSMEDLPGEYIEIDAETFVRGDLWVRVIDGKIRKINRWTVQKLVQSDQGTQCHANNVAVIDANSNTMWSKQIYGYESS